MSLKAEVDWYHTPFTIGAAAPDYVGVGTDVTSLVKVDPGSGGQSLVLEYGRDQVTALAPTVAGRGSMVLDNVDRRFSPRNPSSPLYGAMKPARPVRITRTVETSGYSDLYSDIYSGDLNTFTLFVGNTDDNPINPDVVMKTASLSMVDGLAYFRGIDISTPLYAGIRTGEAIGYILDACGWPTALRSLDAGATVINWFWEDGTDALTALDKVLQSEGSPALLTMGTGGEVVFLDRHHRLTRTASITSQQTWNVDGGAEPVMDVPFEYDEAWRNIINTGLITVDVRTPREIEAVWTLEDAIGFAANETKTFTVSSSDPFRNAITPVSGTDYKISTGSLSAVSLSRTSGASTKITLTAGSGGAHITGLQLRAQPVQVAYTVQVTASDATSIADYGHRSYPNDLPWCNQYDAQAILNLAVAERKQPRPVVQAHFFIANSVKAHLLLTRDLSELISINEPETVLGDAGFYIESIAHDLSADFDHRITFGLEAVPPAGPVTAANIFLIGGGAGHQIGDGVLAS